MINLIRFVVAGTLLTIGTGCATPKGAAWSEYYFGSADAEREAELVCLRYAQHYPNCDVAKLRTLAEAVDITGNNRCTHFTERSTAMAQEWGIENVSYVFIPGDTKTGRDAHVALLVTTPEGKYVVDNGSVDTPLFYRTGSLEEFIASVDGEVVEIPRRFLGAEARKYDTPITVIDAVVRADRKIEGIIDKG